MRTFTEEEVEEMMVPRTNGDRIRGMSDEELAEFMEPREFDCAEFCGDFCNGCMGKCKHNMGKEFLLDWLQSEVW